jgi:hypothetical protein
MSEQQTPTPPPSQTVPVLTGFQIFKLILYAYRFNIIYTIVTGHLIVITSWWVFNHSIAPELNTKTFSIWFFYALYALISFVKSVRKIV